METAIVSEEGKSHPLALTHGRPAARFLWGWWPGGNPFECPSSDWGNDPAAADRKSQPADGEPVSYAHGPDNPDRGACQHVARMMRQKHETG